MQHHVRSACCYSWWHSSNQLCFLHWQGLQLLNFWAEKEIMIARAKKKCEWPKDKADALIRTFGHSLRKKGRGSVASWRSEGSRHSAGCNAAKITASTQIGVHCGRRGCCVMILSLWWCVHIIAPCSSSDKMNSYRQILVGNGAAWLNSAHRYR